MKYRYYRENDGSKRLFKVFDNNVWIIIKCDRSPDVVGHKYKTWSPKNSSFCEEITEDEAFLEMV